MSEQIANSYDSIVTAAIDAYEQEDFPSLAKRLEAAKALGDIIKTSVGVSAAVRGVDLNLDDRVDVTINLVGGRDD